MLLKLSVVSPVLLVLVFCISYSNGSSFEEDTTLTPEQKAALDEFRIQILPKIPASSYVKKLVKDDLYLAKWLRAGNFKIKTAVDQLMNHLEWREREKIDTIVEEDWSILIKEFPVYFDTVDKQGRPIMEVWFNEWPTRQAVIAGKLKKVNRLITMVMESVNRQVYERRGEGQNITRAILLGGLEGANVIQQLCPSCLPVYISMVSNLETHYPFLMEKIYLLSMPPQFDILLRLIKPIIRANTRESLTPYVTRKQWLSVLDNTIDRTQRSMKFGGDIARE